MQPSEFKARLEHYIHEAVSRGLSDEEIYIEFLEQVRHMTSKQMIKVAEKQRRLSHDNI